MIRQHVHSRPFGSRLVRAGRQLAGVRGPSGRLVAADDRLPSVEAHLLKRTVVDRQWPLGTTAAAYVEDLRRAVVHPFARLLTYQYRGEDYGSFLAPNDFTPLAPARLSHVFVAYSATYGVIWTGYQASSPDLALPHDGVERLVEHPP